MARRLIHRGVHLACSLGLLAGCQLASPTPVEPPRYEGIVSADIFGNVRIDMAGRAFVLKAGDGKQLKTLAIRAAGELYPVKDGKFQVPASVMLAARERGGGTFWVFAQGYAPKQVWLGQTSETITLSPQFQLFIKPDVPRFGAMLEAPDSSVRVQVPAGLLAREKTNIAFSGYVPPVTSEDQSAFDTNRSRFLERVKGVVAAGGGNLIGQSSSNLIGQAGSNVIGNGTAGFRVASHAECAEAERPLPCHIEASLGSLLTVDGAIQTPGSITVIYDLQRMLNGWDGTSPAPWLSDAGWTALEIAEAETAARLLRTFRQIDAHPEGWAYRKALAADYGIFQDGELLSFKVPLDASGTYDGSVRTDVAGFELLGVKLEVTVVSSASAFSPLPGAASLADLSALSSVNLLGSFASNANAIIGTGGAGVISNNGSSLTGQVRLPVAAAPAVSPGATAGTGAEGASPNGTESGKWRVLHYGDAEAASASVSLRNLAGEALSWPVSTDAQGRYAFAQLPDMPRLFLVQATAGTRRASALAALPFTQAAVVNLDAASTAVADWVRDRLAQGARAEDFNGAGFRIDAAAFRIFLEDAQAEQAVLNTPQANAALVDAVAAANGHTMLSLTAPTSSRFAGTGEAGYADGPAAEAAFKQPDGLTIDAQGNLYVADSANDRIRKITPSGQVVTVAPAAALNNPTAIAVDGSGNLFVVERGANRISKVAPDGSTSVFAGGATGMEDGRGTRARFQRPQGLAIDAAGNLYVADTGNHAIRKIDPTGNVTTLAGTGGNGFVNGPGGVARFHTPVDVAVDAAGNVYVSERNNRRVRKIDLAGNVSTLAGSGASGALNGPSGVARFQKPAGLTVDAQGNVYLVDGEAEQLRLIAPDGTVSTVAGPAGGGGALVAAPFERPRDVVVGQAGEVYVSEEDSHTIRRIL